MRIKIKEAREHFKEVNGYTLTIDRLSELVECYKMTLVKMNTKVSHPDLLLVAKICYICGVITEDKKPDFNEIIEL